MRSDSTAAANAWASITDFVMSGIAHERFLAACQTIDVTPPVLKALMSMDPGVAEPMRTIAAKLRCDASWVTSLVDTLESRGLVERQNSRTDRRVKTIALTSAGIAAKARALTTLNVPPPEMAILTENEQRRLCALLTKLRNAHALVAT